MNKCDNYLFSWEDLFIPPKQTYNLICNSVDKTNLFISTILRCCVIIILILSIPKNILIDNLLLLFGYIYLMYNIALIIGVMIKKNMFPKNDIQIN